MGYSHRNKAIDFGSFQCRDNDDCCCPFICIPVNDFRGVGNCSAKTGDTEGIDPKNSQFRKLYYKFDEDKDKDKE